MMNDFHSIKTNENSSIWIKCIHYRNQFDMHIILKCNNANTLMTTIGFRVSFLASISLLTYGTWMLRYVKIHQKFVFWISCEFVEEKTCFFLLSFAAPIHSMFWVSTRDCHWWKMLTYFLCIHLTFNLSNWITLLEIGFVFLNGK